jgi:protein-L-isoaspartate(D-aspartate) O-methyltransferase
MASINQAFEAIQRADFVPEGQKDLAGIDVPLSIGFGQTISQPTTVRMMLEWLGAQPGDKILDLGSGSGWTTALLSRIVGPKGKVLAVEIVPELVEFGRNNCQRAGLTNVQFFQAGKEYGLPKYAPYDRVLVNAAAQQLPKQLLKQLKLGGKLVIPVQYDVLEIIKTSDTNFRTTTHPGFVFVPLV